MANFETTSGLPFHCSSLDPPHFCHKSKHDSPIVVSPQLSSQTITNSVAPYILILSPCQADPLWCAVRDASQMGLDFHFSNSFAS